MDGYILILLNFPSHDDREERRGRRDSRGMDLVCILLHCVKEESEDDSDDEWHENTHIPNSYLRVLAGDDY